MPSHKTLYKHPNLLTITRGDSISIHQSRFKSQALSTERSTCPLPSHSLSALASAFQFISQSFHLTAQYLHARRQRQPHTSVHPSSSTHMRYSPPLRAQTGIFLPPTPRGWHRAPCTAFTRRDTIGPALTLPPLACNAASISTHILRGELRSPIEHRSSSAG
jgi:hypothetical protein